MALRLQNPPRRQIRRTSFSLNLLFSPSLEHLLTIYSLYVTNLSPKLRKPDLRLSLYTLFSTYGPVLDVVALKTVKMREQAHVVFRDVGDATLAMRAEQGRDFFGRELKIAYAKGKSDVIRRLDGTFRIPEKMVETTAPTTLQQEVFGKAPGGPLEGTVSTTKEVQLPLAPIPKPAETRDNAAVDGDTAKGVKRQREESEGEEDGEQPMEEESDVEMEASSADESE